MKTHKYELSQLMNLSLFLIWSFFSFGNKKKLSIRMLHAILLYKYPVVTRVKTVTGQIYTV